MSSIENVGQLEKARQDLKEARQQMLDEAKSRCHQSAEHSPKMFLGDTTRKKLKKKSKELKKLKKKKDKKNSKSNKKAKRKKKQSTSEDESESSDHDSVSQDTDSSSSNNSKSYKQLEASKKKQENIYKSNESSCYINGSEDKEGDKLINLEKYTEPLKRDSWMTDGLMLKTYSRERVENKSNNKPQNNTYDPTRSSLELNPYWKTTGTGLPGFQRPTDDDDYENTNSKKSVFARSSMGIKTWRRQCGNKSSNDSLLTPQKVSEKPNDNSPPSARNFEKESRDNSAILPSEFLTDKEMNELGAKILKAEIMGNMELADELRGKLEKARSQRNICKERQKSALNQGKQNNSYKSKGDRLETNKDDYILLTHTDQAGHSRPIPTSNTLDSRDLYGGRKKYKQRPTYSQNKSDKRVGNSTDDDRYDIKQMFEREKCTSSSDVNSQFANIVCKQKVHNDDFADIFTEQLFQDDPMRSDLKDRNKAIQEHKKIEAVLDNCDKCFDSRKMQRELLICVGVNVYLSLPWYQGLQPGHCMLIPIQHASCSTQIDEDTWAEVNEFRKALTRMFASQNKDVIFFEIANKLHRRPHLIIHCVPISKSDGEMAPFYFKKAIEESEHEWCVNKQLVSLQNKSLRNSIPKSLPYFWVHFGMDTGFAHVIEDEERFPKNFAQEIIGGMLNLDANKWRRQQKEHDISTKVRTFANWWKKYDCRY